MAYPDPFDPTTPAADAALGEGDDRIRELKRALIQRLETLIVDIDADPLVLIDQIITMAAIADSAIDATKLADDAVTTVKILAANVTEPKLADGAVSTRTLADESVTGPKLDPTLLDGLNPASLVLVKGPSTPAISNAGTLISWATEVLDADGYFNPAAPTRITIPAGKATNKNLIFACISFGPATVAGTPVEIVIKKNGATILAQNAMTLGTVGGTNIGLSVSVVDSDLTVGDYYTVTVNVGPGGSANIALNNAADLLAGFSLRQIT